MARDAKRAKEARRDKRRRTTGGGMDGIPPFPEAAMRRVLTAWNRAVATGLMDDGAETKYHFAPDGEVLSVAVGKSGQVLGNGERLTPSVAERLRRELPLLAHMVTFYERNQTDGRGLDGAPEDGMMLLDLPAAPDPMPPLDRKALAAAEKATKVLVREGKVSEGDCHVG
ncbi:hypothetical protein ACIGXM_35565 [Kitasatospora sp. NPDC052896]|uniref:hypothetical protein n=1 Tax=Kitasatospora sp. NPDC052896 TaxID=3364061 RepID=UPI0037CC70BD